MKKLLPLFSFLAFMASIISSCSRKTNPPASAGASAPKTEETKTVKRATVKTAVPKVIVVNDNVAKRSVDGRYYYDLEGRRYWRNNRDGKYYLYYRGIFDNPDFNAPTPQ